MLTLRGLRGELGGIDVRAAADVHQPVLLGQDTQLCRGHAQPLCGRPGQHTLRALQVGRELFECPGFLAGPRFLAGSEFFEHGTSLADPKARIRPSGESVDNRPGSALVRPRVWCLTAGSWARSDAKPAVGRGR